MNEFSLEKQLGDLLLFVRFLEVALGFGCPLDEFAGVADGTYAPLS